MRPDATSQRNTRSACRLLSKPAAQAGATTGRWVVAVVTLGLAWRLLRYALCFPFWGDEAYLNLSILHRGYAELLQPLEYAQIAPLLFLWIQRSAYLLLGGGEYALRLFPLLAGCTALLLFAALARRELPGRAAAAAIGIFSVTYLLVRHTCESKPYAGDLLASTLLVWLAARWRGRPAAAGAAWTACAAAAALPWLSYPAVFVAGGVSLLMLCSNLRRPTGRGWQWWLAYNLLLVGSWLLFFFVFAAPHVRRAAGSWLEEYWTEGFPPTGNLGGFLWWLVKVHTGSMLAYPIGGPHFASSATALLCLVGIIWLLRQRRPGTLLLCIAPALPTFVAAAFHRYPYGDSLRVSIHLAPGICLLAGAGAGALLEFWPQRAHQRAVSAALAAVLLAFPVIGAIRDVLYPYKAWEEAAARRVMAQVAATIRPDDVVAIYNASEGTHGPPDGPVFYQTLRYYLEFYTGIRPRWRMEHGLTPDVDVLLVYHGPQFGPDRQRVADALRAAGLVISCEYAYALSRRSAAQLVVYRCTAAP